MGDGDQEYRLNRIEHDIAEIKAALMAIQASVSTVQLGLPDKFVSKLEYTDRRLETDKRFEKLEAANQRMLWWIIGILVMAVTSLGRSILVSAGV